MIRIDEDRLCKLFKELCLINAPSLQEAHSSAFVKKILETMGLEVHEDDSGREIGSNSNNILAKLKANKPGCPTIFFSAHFDTVEPTEGLVIGEEEGVYFSESDTILGADDKAGMAPAIEAIRILMEDDIPHGDVWLLFSTAEEIGLKGAGAMKIEDLGVDYGYVLDTGPPVGSFVNRTATHDKLDIFIEGKPAHAGKDPENGINAIQVASDAIAQMKLGRIGPETTANLGIISGGTGTNVVCPSVSIQAEARSTSIPELDAQIDHMIKLFEGSARKFGAQVTIQHDRHYRSYLVDENEEVVKIGMKASSALGMNPFLRTTLGGSDANMFNKKGIPTIVCGTGMDKIHTHDEYVSRKDLVDMARLCVQIAIEAANSRD